RELGARRRRRDRHLHGNVHGRQGAGRRWRSRHLHGCGARLGAGELPEHGGCQRRVDGQWDRDRRGLRWRHLHGHGIRLLRVSQEAGSYGSGFLRGAAARFPEDAPSLFGGNAGAGFMPSQQTRSSICPIHGDNAIQPMAGIPPGNAPGQATEGRVDATESSNHAGDLLDGSGPPPGPVTIEIVSATAAVVTLGGDHDVASLDAVSDAFRVAGAGRDLLVDLSDCTFIDSTIIKLLLRTGRSLEATGARFELVIDPTPSGHVARVAALMGISEVIPTHDTRTGGIHSLSSPSDY